MDIIEKIITSSSGIRDNKFINIDLANEEIKKNIAINEKKLNYIKIMSFNNQFSSARCL